MRVTFDSNVWEEIVTTKINVPSIYGALRYEIEKGNIQPYICEISLSLESILKPMRLVHASTYKPKIKITSREYSGRQYHERVSIGPDNETHPGMHPILFSKFQVACALGFKVLTMTNFGTARAQEISEDVRIKFLSIDDFWSYAERLSECSGYIESLGCGSYAYHKLVDKYKLRLPSYKKLHQLASKTEIKQFSLSVAEWADGDSLAAHYAFNNDYFCTNDQAGNAGGKSVFHPDNLHLVSKKFGIQVITPDCLLNLIKN